jgi:YidC/Oxa1 family membrane protein insertase
MNMDSFRLFAGIVFAVSVFLLVQEYMKERQPSPVSQTAHGLPRSAVQVPAPGATSSVAPSTAPSVAATAPQRLIGSGQKIKVRTDTLAAEIDLLGGDLHRVELLQHKDRFDKSKAFVLLEDDPDKLYIAQSGFREGLPGETATFQAGASDYELKSGERELRVVLVAKSEQGAVEKTYTFHRGSYIVDVALRVTNTSKAAFAPSAYFRLVRDGKPPEGESRMMPALSAVEIYTDKDKLKKISFDDVKKVSVEDVRDGKDPYQRTASDGWLAFVQHYFLSAWLPEPGSERKFYVHGLSGGLISGTVLQGLHSIGPGDSAAISAKLYVGPQERDILEALARDALAPGLELAVDYGWLRPLAVPLFWVLNRIHEFVANWGVAIIILTVLIKLLFYPLSAASYRSMAKMKVVAPKLQKLKERYGDDRQKLHEAMMNLYKTERINPLGGCLPILVQIPVFIALYWVLLLSVELRHAPFTLWIQDLSRPDPVYVLPVLMGITMFLQSWMNPAPPDPVQARLMKIMPIAFSVFFFFFPAGLVLYWLVNNVLSIAQQWQITRTLERSKTARGDS